MELLHTEKSEITINHYGKKGKQVGYDYIESSETLIHKNGELMYKDHIIYDNEIPFKTYSIRKRYSRYYGLQQKVWAFHELISDIMSMFENWWYSDSDAEYRILNSNFSALIKWAGSQEYYNEDYWIDIKKHPLTPEHGEVIGFNRKWIDKKINPNGTRIGFCAMVLSGKCSLFESAKWCTKSDSYEGTNSIAPTHYHVIPKHP